MIKADPALSIQPECKQEVENRFFETDFENTS